MVSNSGFSRHSGAAKRRSLASAFELGSTPSILPQASSPSAQAWAPAVISAIGSVVGPSAPGMLNPNALGLAIPGIAPKPANGWLLPLLSRPSAQACISICCARPITSVQCCQSSRLGIPAGPVVVLSVMSAPLLVIASEAKQSSPPMDCFVGTLLARTAGDQCPSDPGRARAARLFRDRGVRRLGRSAGRRKAADARHLYLLRGGDRGRRRHNSRPVDRRAGVLGPQQRDLADLHRRRAFG